MDPGGLNVLLVTEGTYPVDRGGVSTWCDLLVGRMEGVRFTVMTVMANPYLPARYGLPAQVGQWVRTPLWGTQDPAEILNLPVPDLLERWQQTTPEVVLEQFLPCLGRLLDACWGEEPIAGPDIGPELVRLHELFQTYDYQTLFKDPAVWRWYVTVTTEIYGPRYGLEPTLHDLVQSLGWVYRFLVVLSAPIPKADLTHASAAAFCALPGVVARRLRGTPLVVTEHGVYLREQYANIGRAELTAFQRRALLGLVQTVARTAYLNADVVAPVAAFNQRWEEALGVDPGRIRVIYNGVDPEHYRPCARPPGSAPTVVCLARIDPVKDLETLLRAAAIVRQRLPDVRFVVHGGVSVPSYLTELEALRSELDLAEVFTFAGHSDNVQEACAAGDVMVLSSRSEGFPYAVLEGMMCGMPIVATDVGGLREALGETGLLVPPRAPEALAEALLRLLAAPDEARALGARARERAQERFSVEGFVARYRNLYQELAHPDHPAK